MAILTGFEGSGGIRWILTVNGAYSGADVKLVNGTTALYMTADSDGIAEFNVPYTGTWSVSQNASTTIDDLSVVLVGDATDITVPNATTATVSITGEYTRTSAAAAAAWAASHTFANASWLAMGLCSDVIQEYYVGGNSAITTNWAPGQTNTTATLYGSYSSITLQHVLTDTQKGSDYYNTDGGLVVGFTNTIASSTYMSSNQAQWYFSGSLHNTCNGTIYSGLLDSNFKAALKPWTCWVGNANTGTSSISTGYTQEVYLAAPSVVEVGSSNSYNSSEASKCFKFSSYTLSKSGVNTIYWLRSPSCYNGGYRAYRVSNGSVSSGYNVDNGYGVAPIGCI